MISKTFPAAPFAAAIVPMFGAACPSAIDDDNTQKKTFTEKKHPIMWHWDPTMVTKYKFYKSSFDNADKIKSKYL